VNGESAFAKATADTVVSGEWIKNQDPLFKIQEPRSQDPKKENQRRKKWPNKKRDFAIESTIF